ncbi:MAG TPA: hypothetical protein VGB38_09285 [bacterium]
MPGQGDSGGAVVTASYVSEIGAGAYVKDGAAAADRVEELTVKLYPIVAK